MRQAAIELYEEITGTRAPDHRLATWWPSWSWIPGYDGLAIGSVIFLHPEHADIADYCHELEHVRQWHIFGPRMWWQWVKYGFGDRNRFERSAYAIENRARNILDGRFHLMGGGVQ